ncbi:MAG: AMP-binding protein [Kineosporiaceae bacterium]
MSRTLQPLPVPTGPAVRDLLAPLRAALSGNGPALLPHPAGIAPPAGAAPGQPLGQEEDDPADPTAVAVATSGSTGSPKVALLPASALLASASATHDRLGGPGRWLLALPAQHIAGLQVLVRSLLTGTTPTILDLRHGFDPAEFAAAAERMAGRATGHRRYTALVPTQVVRLLDAGGAAVQALAGFDAVLIGGAATPEPLRERAAAAGVRLVTTYGMSETCGGCVYDGIPLDGVQITVDPETGTETGTDAGTAADLDAGTAGSAGSTGAGGRISLGGTVIARGYRTAPDDGSFRTDISGVRWFRTGDIGTLDAPGTRGAGRLHVAGRVDDLISTGGMKVAPAVVEAVLLALPGVAEAVVLGVDDTEWGQRVVAAIVPSAGSRAPDLTEVRAAVRDRVAPHAAPRQLLVLDRLPLHGPGKPDRAELARRARQG